MQAVPILENHKIEAVARAKYDEDTVRDLVSSAMLDMSNFLRTAVKGSITERHKQHQTLKEKYLPGHLIRADRLNDLLPLLETGVARERLEVGQAGLDLSTPGSKWRINKLKRHEVLIDVLSMCNDRLTAGVHPITQA